MQGDNRAAVEAEAGGLGEGEGDGEVVLQYLHDLAQ